MAIEQWGTVSVPRLLWHGTSVYNSHFRGSVTLTSVAEHMALEFHCHMLDSSTVRHKVWESRILRDDHYKQMPLSTVFTCFYDLGLSWHGFDYPTVRWRGERSNSLRHQCSNKQMKSINTAVVTWSSKVHSNMQTFIRYCLFVCLFGFFVPLENVSLIWNVTITALNFDYARNLWPLSSEGSLACHNHCDTGHPFIMVFSMDPWHSNLLSNVWQWSCHYLILQLRSVAAGIRTPNLSLAGRTL